MEITAIKFNAETDPNRPVIGSEIVKDDKSFIIGKVDHKEMSEIMKMVTNGVEPDKEGFDDVLFDQHPDRPLLYWMIFVNEIKK